MDRKPNPFNDRRHKAYEKRNQELEDYKNRLKASIAEDEKVLASVDKLLKDFHIITKFRYANAGTQ